nr:exodeoxyribonuclease large subunit [Candidatus Cloacimonadota bacterium]
MDNITVFSVFEVTRHLKQVIESSIAPLYVKGEIAGFTHHSSGHMYFNLKDEYSSLRCTFFKNRNYDLDFQPSNGQSVICFGQLTVYEKSGSYNLNVSQMLPSGMGEMQIKFEALKKKLDEEGLFANERKKPLPKYPQTIGIITSPTGAALQDIKNVLSRRFPIKAWVYPVLVQGQNAPASMIRALRYFNSSFPVDLLILTRGGGSQEDLFCFNDEALAREIAASKIPVISAVGHEIDFTISDFVADFRAPTPSAAAELAVPNRDDLLSYISSLEQKLGLLINNKLSTHKHRLNDSEMKLLQFHPRRIIGEYLQRVDLAAMALGNIHYLLKKQSQALAMAEQRFIENATLKLQINIRRREEVLNRQKDLLDQRATRIIDEIRHHLEILQYQLEQSSPQNLQKRGWIMARKGDKIIRSISEIDNGDRLALIFVDGQAKVEVKETK